MSIYGMKPTFTNFEDYKAWRKSWTKVYGDISKRIARSKSLIASWNRKGMSGGALAREWTKLRGMQVAAHKLNTVLEEAKLRMNNITNMHRGMVAHYAQFPLTIENCPAIDFHFNKKHLEFPWMPMWIVKTKGQTYYVNHVEANAPWTTKETPEHASTKGALRFRRCDLHINKEGVATITASKAMVEA